MNVSQHKVKGHNTNQMFYRGGSDIALEGAPAPSHFVTMLQHQGVTLFFGASYGLFSHLGGQQGGKFIISCFEFVDVLDL